MSKRRGEEDSDSDKEEEVKVVGLKTRVKQEGWLIKDDYELMFEIGQGITLPEKEKNYKVQVSVQNQDWPCELPKEKKGEYVRWHRRSQVMTYKLPKNRNSLFTIPKEDLTAPEELRIYIYLLNEDDKPISFWWGPLSDFMELDAKWRWIQLKPDRTYGEVEEDYLAGMVSVKISVARLEQNGGGTIPWANYNAWSE